MVSKHVIYTIAVACCSAQLLDVFFPNVASGTRRLTDVLTKHPLLITSSNIAGNVLASAVNTITSVPISIARSLGVGITPHALVPDINTVDYGNILAQFNAGAGDEDAVLTIGQLIVKYGYPMEQHEIVTSDEYILTVFRIPSDGPVVFLMHGLLGSADDYVFTGPDKALAYLLADEGYDVWMGNARGNKWSRRHRNLQPSQAAFWDFSWHEIGVYDLPAMIDYILGLRNETKLKYIGHSQGTTVFFVMASERPEYNDKISIMVALSPVAYMSHAKSPLLRLIVPGENILYSIATSFGIYEFLPDDSVTRILKLIVCGNSPLAEIFCSNAMFLVVGFGFEQLNVTNVPVMFGHYPGGSSAKQLVHFGQGILSGDFKNFDYGSSGNLRKYGSRVPPSYRLENIRAPVSLFYSDADWLADPQDVDILYNRLPNAVDIHRVPSEQFNHLDFLLAKDFKILIYKRLRKILALFS